MASRQENNIDDLRNQASKNAIAATESDLRFMKSNPTSPAGSENSLGAESVRDGRPATDDDTVEAIDEEGPGITNPLAEDAQSARGRDSLAAPRDPS